jgi:hypothetical protein
MPSAHIRRNLLGEMPTLSVKWFVNDPRLLYPTASDISVTLIVDEASSRRAWYIRTAERNLPGETENAAEVKAAKYGTLCYVGERQWLTVAFPHVRDGAFDWAIHSGPPLTALDTGITVHVAAQARSWASVQRRLSLTRLFVCSAFLRAMAALRPPDQQRKGGDVGWRACAEDRGVRHTANAIPRGFSQ